ncbi:MAG: hypothetical protein R2880_13295 [Deinococcales bacterium]
MSGEREGVGEGLEPSFKKENNPNNDYNDIYASMTTSTLPNASATPPHRQASLENVFDLDSFLKWLAPQ